MRVNRKAIPHLILLAGIGALLFGSAGTGYAKAQLPTVTSTLGATASPVATEASPTASVDSQQPFMRVLVKISQNAHITNVMARMGSYGKVTESDILSELGVFILDIPANNLEEKLVELGNISGVGYVEPDYPVLAADTIPNDPSFPSQYGLTAIRAPQGWDLSSGSSSVTIAFMDSGVDLAHPELAGKIVPGYDFVNNDNVPQDDYGHGTHVAGIAAALGNNGLGIAGVSWGARIMPVKVLDSSGGGSVSGLAAGIVWAADHGAQIINMSLGTLSYSQVLQDAVTYADGNGILMTAASGNTNSNVVLYPARFPQVMAVAATDASNQRASFSNYGPEIDIAAPGDNILSLLPGGYGILSGTSMATSYVSGLAAILFGYTNNPTAVRDDLEATALDISPPGADIYTGAGLIQMDAAIRQIIPPPTPTQEPDQSKPKPPGPIQLFPTFTPFWTQTPSLTITAVPATQTLTSTPVLTPSDLPTLTADPQPFTPTPELKALDKKSGFLSPYFLCGTSLILLGALILFLFARKHSHRPNYLR